MSLAPTAVLALAVAGLLTIACATETEIGSPPASSSGTSLQGDRCVVHLHGKGGTGAPPSMDGDTLTLRPHGNAEGWGARQWLYDTEARYRAARTSVAEAVDASGCKAVIVHGFSNGGAFAAKLYCHGETLGGRLLGVIIDDPVPDHAVEGCSSSPEVRAVLYWTGALASTAVPGWPCAPADWTCEGGTTLGIDAYASALTLPVLPSAQVRHEPYLTAPELDTW